MRTNYLLPFSALIAVVAGCGGEGTEQSARSGQSRDLTLVTQTAEVQIASPVETQQLRPQQRTVLRSQPAARLARARRSSPQEPTIRLAAVAAPILAAPEPVVQPVTAPAPLNDRELLPGKTITVIPASSGPSTGADETDELPAARGRTMVTGGGGTCRGRGRGRGPGIGIATAPRPDFR